MRAREHPLQLHPPDAPLEPGQRLPGLGCGLLVLRLHCQLKQHGRILGVPLQPRPALQRVGQPGALAQERIVEHAAAIVRSKPGRVAYVTAAVDITKDCDCLTRHQQSLLDDIGLLASTDPVALDQAVLDLVVARVGRTLESLSYPSRDATVQLRHAEALGLGERAYELVTVAPLNG